ncbi:DUF6642 family protein [Leeuwenhoekiella aequorea]|uniref:CHAT domain-containing protein n=1 Tax=Leeuwenhoekiella aequorea TaxID=283736 RepID=A0A4Q0P830_9FLAO|nr:DUF6642 family protein [Leeuwenhoekiella aequorea]RXG21919.1 hypothetical protein DSM00_1983 [Leeuwenhoekiella aequorea]
MKPDNHIFAIEGEWETKLNKELTIKSTLTLLKEVCNVESIFRKTNTVESLIQYLEVSSTASYKKYGTIVIGTHGDKGEILLSDSESISIRDLAGQCENLFTDKIVHFSSCGILKRMTDIEYFKKLTNAKGVCGYSKKVLFLESSIFDILLFNRLYRNNSLTKTQEFLMNNYPDLVKKLGFKVL